MTNSVGFLLGQLANQAPTLLVYLIGLVLALVFWNRCPRPCVFTLIATLILLITRLAAIGANYYFLQQMMDRAWSNEQYALASFIANLISSVIQAGALGLLLAAIFINRLHPRPGPMPRGALDRPVSLPAPGSPHVRE